MTAQAAALHTDTDGKATSAQYVNRGDGVTDWVLYGRLGALEKAEDAAHVSGDYGVQLLAVRRDVATASAGTDGDYSPVSVDALGRLRVTGTHLEDVAAASGDAGVHLLGVRRDTPASSAGTDGDYASLGLDAFGRLQTVFQPVATNTAGWSRAKSAGALATSLVVKASAGRLRSVLVTSTLAAKQFLQVHNAAALPGNGATPEHVMTIPANDSVVLDLTELGGYYSTGIVVAVSTTAATLTVGAADSVFSALYI